MRDSDMKAIQRMKEKTEENRKWMESNDIRIEREFQTYLAVV